MKIKRILMLALIFALIPANHAFAHKVIVFAWVEQGYIHTESSFGSKSKAKDCPIIVVDENGRVIHKGRTDSKGNYSFKIPERVESDLIVNLDAGIGHKAQWRIPKQELIKEHTTEDLKVAMKEKDALEKGPSAFQIIGGIAIIFLLAFGATVLKKRKKS